MPKIYVPPIAVFALISFLLLVAVATTDCTCDALNYYRLSWDFLGDIDTQFWAVVLLAAGVAIYYIITRLLKWDSEIVKYVYWGLLPLVVFHSAISTVKHNLKVGATEQSICTKTTNAKKGGGIVSTNLTLEEYQYLQPDRGELPNLPPTATNITLWFNGGDFIGDYILELTFKCGANEKIATSEKWTLKSVNKKSGTKTISYSRHPQ
jgi:hypothetical protein